MSRDVSSVAGSKVHVKDEDEDSSSSEAARVTGVARPARRPARRLCPRGTSDAVESEAVRGSEAIARAFVTST
jgi:hypothetical protein